MFSISKYFFSSHYVISCTFNKCWDDECILLSFYTNMYSKFVVRSAQATLLLSPPADDVIVIKWC